jgi:large subunit ribosomal protein L3
VKFAVTKKIGMTRVFDAEGNSLPVTLLLNVPVKVSKIIKADKNGYQAIVVEEISQKKNDKKGLKNKVNKYEFKLNGESDIKVGDEIKLSDFQKGDKAEIIGTGKGKGFAGVIKRHSFHRGPKTHGSDHHRAVGSIGGGYPQRVVLGRRMPGRMGVNQVTIKNIEVAEVSEDNSVIALSGSIPGAKNSLVKIYTK